MVTETALGANLLENGSFECGDLRGWSFSAYGDGAIIPMWFTNDAAGAFHGQHYVYITKNPEDNARNYASKLYLLKPSTTYTLSYYGKSSSADSNGREVNGYIYQNASSTPVLSIAGHTSAAWQRFSGSFTTTNLQSACLYQVRFVMNKTTTYEYACLDAVQLEEGASATAFTVHTPVEVGAALDRSTPGHIYHTTNSIALPLVSFNNASAQASVTAYWTVYDFWNNPKASGSASITVPASNSITNTVPVTLTNLGTFRFVAFVTNVADSITESTFSRINPPIAIGNRTNGIFGTEAYSSAWYLESLQRMGIHWNRHLSVLPFARWNKANETEGVFVEWTNRLALERQYDVEPLGQLGSDTRNVPLWASAYPSSKGWWPDSVKWSNYVYRIVTDYKPYVSWWEVWNEEVEPYPTPLTNVLTWAYGAITNADSTAKVIGPADDFSSGHHYMSNILAVIGGVSITNAYTLHFYPTRENLSAEALGDIAPFGLDTWNSESGYKFGSYHLTALQELSDFGLGTDLSPLGSGYTRNFDSRFPMMVKNIAWTLAGGLKKFFYYDARHTGGNSGYVSYSIFDYDNTLNPMGAMLANFAQIMDTGTALGIPSLDTDVFSFAWSQSNRVCFFLVSTNANLNTNATTRLAVLSSLPANQVTFYDMFGNAKPSGVVTFGRDPIYLRGADGVASNTLAESLSIYPTNDTAAPKIVISSFPTSQGASGSFLFHWNGMDDSTLSTWWTSTTNSTLYSYRLGSGGWSGWQNENWAIIDPWSVPSFSVRGMDASGNIGTSTINLSDMRRNASAEGRVKISGNAKTR